MSAAEVPATGEGRSQTTVSLFLFEANKIEIEKIYSSSVFSKTSKFCTFTSLNYLYEAT